MVNADRRIGENLQALRGSMSQAALASLMKDRGWRWSQPTVAAIEKGERPLKVAEAEHLVDILGLKDMEALTVRPLRALADSAHDRMVRSADALRLAAMEFWDAQRHLAWLADQIGADASAEDQEVWRLWLPADPADIITTVVPQAPETLERFKDPEVSSFHPWSKLLAEGAYGAHSARATRNDNDGAPTDSAQ